MTKFIVVTDTHIANPVQTTPCLWWNNLLLHLVGSELADAWIAEVNDRKPDFLLHCGDLMHRVTRAAAKDVRTMMDRLDCPYYMTLGNHDFTNKEDVSENDLLSILGIPGNTPDYACNQSGFRITAFAFDATYTEDEIEQKINWLENELQNETELPLIFLTHAPLSLDMRERSGSVPGEKPGCGSISEHLKVYLWPQRERILELLQKRGNVVGIFTGHTHTSDVTYPGGLLHCVTPAMSAYPCAIRECQIQNDEITVKSIHFDKFAEQSLVKERGNQWVKGTPETQEFVHNFKTIMGNEQK